MLIGSVYMAMGCFASSLTRSQIIAAMVSFLLGIGLWIVSLRPVSTHMGDGRWARLLDELSLLRHMDDFARGILDSRHIVLHVTVTFLFLFLTQRVVESRRWK
jgi:ABC-2 type transport system permease protein